MPKSILYPPWSNSVKKNRFEKTPNIPEMRRCKKIVHLAKVLAFVWATAFAKYSI